MTRAIRWPDAPSRYVVVVMLCLAVLCVCSVDAAEDQVVGPDIQVRRLADRVWMHQTRHTVDTGQSLTSNGLLIDTTEAVILVDTPWGVAETRGLLDWAQRNLGRPVSRAVLTHGHEDRIAGLPVLRERGVTLYYAAPVTLGDQARAEDVLLRDVSSMLPVAADVTVFYPGPAHAPDNVMVWIEPERILFGGCAIREDAATGLGYTGDADLAGWRDAIGFILSRFPEPQIVVPGHGEPGSAELLVLTRGHVARAEEAAEAAAEGSRP